MGLQDIAQRQSTRRRQVFVLADVGLALVLVLVSLSVFKPSLASTLDVPYKIFFPLGAILLVARAVASSKENP